MFENLAPRTGLQTETRNVKFSNELRGGFVVSVLVPLLSSLIGAAPAIAGTVIAARNSK